MIPSLEGWPTKAKEAPSPHDVRLTPLDTNPVLNQVSSKATVFHKITILVLVIPKLTETEFTFFFSYVFSETVITNWLNFFSLNSL